MTCQRSVLICATSRFHYQQLAHQLISDGMLYRWISSLPLTKIPIEIRNLTISRPLSLLFYLFSSRLTYAPPALKSLLVYYSNTIFDCQSLDIIKRVNPKVVIGLSHCISKAGAYAANHGACYFCDVPIAHPNFLNQTLSYEYAKLRIPYIPIHQRQIDMEVSAHHHSSRIVCPSSFVKDTLASEGVSPDKITVIPYGSGRVISASSLQASLTKPNAISPSFNILFVGQVSVRKGIHYLLDAFARFSHPHKSLVLAGSLGSDAKIVLSRFNLDHVSVLGVQSKASLHSLYSSSTVFVLPSLSEGFALVIGEAMAYGLPIVYTYETGASEIVTDNVEGLMIKGKQYRSILEAFEWMADNPARMQAMRCASLQRSRSMQGWSEYGKTWKMLIQSNSYNP
jgi:starch synthase